MSGGRLRDRMLVLGDGSSYGVGHRHLTGPPHAAHRGHGGVQQLRHLWQVLIGEIRRWEIVGWDVVRWKIVDIGLGLWERVVGHDTKRYPLRRP